MTIATGLSGNEIYCLQQKGFTAGDLVVGNSVFSVGVGKGILSGLSTIAGGEVSQITELIRDGREQAYQRLLAEAKKHGAVGITGVTLDLIQHLNCQEFLCLGSVLHGEERQLFSTCADGQDLFCQLDAGYEPVSFVFGNVAYSIGVGGGVLGSLRSLKRGEVHEFSEVLYKTRHLALERIAAEASKDGANVVLGIQTLIRPFFDMQEMIMSGTASHNPLLPPNHLNRPATSSLTNAELWSLTQLGYAPLELLLGVSVYSLGVLGGITASLKQIKGGEIHELSQLIYDAREQAIERLKKDAKAIGADEVVGLKVHVYDLGGGMLEFLSIGTAVKKIANLKTSSAMLPAQAVIKELDRYRPNYVNSSYRPLVSDSSASAIGRISINPETELSNMASNTMMNIIPTNNPLISYILPLLIIMLFLLPLLLRGCSAH